MLLSHYLDVNVLLLPDGMIRILLPENIHLRNLENTSAKMKLI